MGYLLRAKCPSCSFRKDVNFGGRMMDMGSTLFAPVLDKKTGKMIEINLKDTNIVLDRYQLYAEPYDYRDKDLETAHQWGDICIRPNGHKCPKCAGNTMRFDIAALID